MCVVNDSLAVSFTSHVNGDTEAETQTTTVTAGTFVLEARPKPAPLTRENITSLGHALRVD